MRHIENAVRHLQLGDVVLSVEVAALLAGLPCWRWTVMSPALSPGCCHCHGNAAGVFSAVFGSAGDNGAHNALTANRARRDKVIGAGVVQQ